MLSRRPARSWCLPFARPPPDGRPGPPGAAAGCWAWLAAMAISSNGRGICPRRNSCTCGGGVKRQQSAAAEVEGGLRRRRRLPRTHQLLQDLAGEVGAELAGELAPLAGARRHDRGRRPAAAGPRTLAGRPHPATRRALPAERCPQSHPTPTRGLDIGAAGRLPRRVRCSATGQRQVGYGCRSPSDESESDEKSNSPRRVGHRSAHASAMGDRRSRPDH